MVDYDYIELLFLKDLESWFSADIACCDSCYDEFLEEWPHVYEGNDCEFQKSGIDLDTFYSGSRLQDYVSLADFRSFIKETECPNCGAILKHNIWPYHLPVDISHEQKNMMEEVGKIAENTPFLVLKHDFANKVLESICEIFMTTLFLPTGQIFVRGREFSKLKYSNSDFFEPPRSVTKNGRYNHAGGPVLYLADSSLTCFKEIRSPHKGVFVADIQINQKMKILDLNEQLDMDENILTPLIWSSLLSSKSEGDGFFKPHYNFSRFVADCAKYAGFDGIKYPSVRATKGSNVVLLNPEIMKDSIIVSNIRSYKK